MYKLQALLAKRYIGVGAVAGLILVVLGGVGVWGLTAHNTKNTNPKDASLSAGTHQSTQATSTPTGATIQVVTPQSNQTLSGVVGFTVRLSDGSVVTRVEYFIDSTQVGSSTDNPFTLKFDTAKLPAGKHQLVAKAYDKTGLVVTSQSVAFVTTVSTSTAKSSTTSGNGSSTASTTVSGTGTSTGGSAGGSSGGVCPIGTHGNSPNCATGVDLTSKNCIAKPSACGYPDATNTGIPAGVTLTQVPSQATSGTNWSYSNGIVTITGNVGTATTGLQLAPGNEIVIPDGVNNAVIRNVKLTGVHGQSDNAITIGTNSCQTSGCGPNNITIENCYIDAQNNTTGSYQSGVYATWQSRSISVKYCDISGASGGIYYLAEAGAEVTAGNYIHNPGAVNASIHVNGITSGSGPADTTSSWLIQYNTVLMTGTNGSQVTAAISLFPDGGPQLNDHATIDQNLLDTGNYYLIDNGYGDAYGSSGQSYIYITNNRLGASGNNAGTYNYTWYISPNLPGCTTGNGGVACTGDTDNGNIWDATLAPA